jgi:hypothetical protein
MRHRGMFTKYCLLLLPASAFCALAPAPALRADEPPLALGGEILVPDAISGDQARPEVASNEDGHFVVAWQSAGADGDGFGILAQMYDSSGLEVGAPIGINTTVAGDQTRPAIGCDDSGDFGIAWQGPDADEDGIFARRYEEDGLPDTSQVAVNTTTAGVQSLPSIAMAENGDFLVAWQSPDAAGAGVWARLFDNDGNPLTGEIQVNVTTAGNQQNPQVRADDEEGGYLVVWEGPDLSGSGIWLRRITAGGVLSGGEVGINDVTAGEQRNPALSVSGIDPDPLDRNLFVVAWQSPDSFGSGIWARVYDDSGTPLSAQFLVNDDDGNNQSEPSVSFDDGEDDGDLDFTVTWTESPVLGIDAAPLFGAPIFIRGRRLNGLPPYLVTGPNAEFAVSVAGSLTAASSVAAENDGDFVTVWQSDGQDGSEEGVYGRRFAGQPIFVDGFETGNTSRWSVTVPAVGPDP